MLLGFCEINIHQHSTKILIKNLSETVHNTNKEREGSPGKSETAVLGTVEFSEPGTKTWSVCYFPGLSQEETKVGRIKLHL